MSPKTKPRILLVDDEDDIRASLRMILDYEGLESIEASNGPEALDRAGYTLCEVGNTEAARLDGGMSCLSLRFTPPS